MAVSITRAHLRTSKTKTYNIDLSENTAKNQSKYNRIKSNAVPDFKSDTAMQHYNEIGRRIKENSKR